MDKVLDEIRSGKPSGLMKVIAEILRYSLDKADGITEQIENVDPDDVDLNYDIEAGILSVLEASHELAVRMSYLDSQILGG